MPSMKREGMVRHLYFHIPFCAKLCPYCNFTVETRLRFKNRRFLDALLAETRARAEAFPVRPETIFLGGGTPSALSLAELEWFAGGLRRALDLSAVAEWTIEINPATVSADKARLLRDLGFDRASVGIQSWDPADLRTLGRIHSPDDSARTLDRLRAAGFGNVSADLIFGVPGQTERAWAETLDRTVAAGVDHVSAYCLTFEEGTEFHRALAAGELRRDEAAEARMFEMAMDRLGAAGFFHYEISNHARPGFDSAHNRAYWLGRETLGIGPGAFSTVAGRRWKNRADTEAYLREALAGMPGADFEEAVPPGVAASERAAFGIRMAEGCAEGDLAPWAGELPRLFEAGLIEQAGGRIRLTRRGKLLADTVAESFV
jgi:oxygen-independent coproporphyrinogen-3 oxidase